MKVQKRKRDRYDDEVNRLTNNPRLIRESWDYAEPLFQHVQHVARPRANFVCGCLTQVASKIFEAATPELTEAIQKDERIPKSVEFITVEHLPLFAEWQRRIDKELKRKAPERL